MKARTEPTAALGCLGVSLIVSGVLCLQAFGQCTPEHIARTQAELNYYSQQRKAMQTQAAKFEQWGIVEVMGRSRFAGQISEVTVAGAGFIRVDVPACGDRAAFSKLFTPSALYSITPTTEEIARGVAARDQQRPLHEYDLPTEWREQMRVGRLVAPAASNPTDDDPQLSDDGMDEDWDENE